MKQITANTFTPVYDPIEDRIRLSVNYQDVHYRVDLMITRAFAIDLLSSADDFILQHYAECPKKRNNPVNVEPKGAVPEKTDSVNFELYKRDDELLREVSFSYRQDSRISVVAFKSVKTAAIAVLNEHTIRQLFDSIRSVIPRFAWGISAAL